MPTRPKNVQKDQLKFFYLQKRLSTDAIAKRFHCNHVTILNYLKKYNIPRRSRLGNRKPIHISKEVLFDLYHKEKLTQKQIADKFCHSRYGIQHWLKIYGISSRNNSESHTKYPKYDFSGDLIEKAYIIGFRLGDLNVSTVKSLIQIRCSTTILEQVCLINFLFQKYGNVHIWKAKRGTYEVIALLNESFSFLLPKSDNIEDWIMTDKRNCLAFIAGYADAEGSYYLRKPNITNGKVPWGIFEIQSYDRTILFSINNILRSLGIECHISLSRKGGYIDRRGIRTNKDCWRITINKKQSLWNYIKFIEPYHKHRRKLQDLQTVKNNILQRNRLRYCKPIVL